MTLLLLVNIPLSSKDIVIYKHDNKRLIDVEDYNSCVREGNQCAELLKKSQIELNQADELLQKCEEAKCPKDYKGYFIAGTIGASAGAIVTVIIFLIILL